MMRDNVLAFLLAVTMTAWPILGALLVFLVLGPEPL